MKNNAQIEMYLRLRAIKELSPEWVVWHPPRVKYFIVDIFGIADLVCLHRATGTVRFLQITTLTNRWARREKMREFFEENHIQFPDGKNPFFLWSFDYGKDKFAMEGF